MAEDRALIEKRDKARRAYKKVLSQLLKIIDRDFKFVDYRTICDRWLYRRKKIFGKNHSRGYAKKFSSSQNCGS
jgi:hypothetical protein